MATAEISFNAPKKVWTAFRQQADELFLKYARYLDYVLAQELPRLDRELGNRVMSTEAKRFIANKLHRLDTTSVNLELSAATAAKLREVVGKHNLVRDAVMTRLVLLLRSSDALLRSLEVPRTIPGRGALEFMPTSPMKALEAVRDDPFYYLRSYLDDSRGEGLWTFDIGLDWATCYLEDADVPGTSAHRKERAAFSSLFEEPGRTRRKPVNVVRKRRLA
jgi:hypothetical protein